MLLSEIIICLVIGFMGLLLPTAMIYDYYAFRR
jgi:hypothetical protein